jgi:hypothetical protein
MGFGLKCDLHYAFIVCEYRFVAVTKVKTPNLDILIRRAGDDQLRVVRDVHTQHRELEELMTIPAGRENGRTYFVSIEGQEKFERVLVEYLDRRVQEGHSQELSVRTVSDGQDILCHFERARMNERQMFPGLCQDEASDHRASTVQGKFDIITRCWCLFKLPKFYIFIRASADQRTLVSTHVQGPNCTRVRVYGLDQRRRGQIVEQYLSSFSSDGNLPHASASQS